jgi:acetyltransferase-like isoleucine patch superfamily enzyme
MRDVPDRKIVAGAPAKVIMDVPEEQYLRQSPEEGE